jgi:DNA-binding beta-propeller fold protein YncE
VTNFGPAGSPSNYPIPGVGAYTLSGAQINPVLIPDSPGTLGIAASGGELFVTNRYTQTVSKYGVSGAPINAPLMSTREPTAIAVDDGFIYVASFGYSTVSKYTTAGVLVNSNLISPLPGSQGFMTIAVADGKVFTTSLGNNGGYLSVHSTSGAPINTSLISDLNYPAGLAVSGNSIFISEVNSSRISKYALDGTLIAQSLIPDLHAPRGMAIVGDDLYVVNAATHSVGHYTTSGATINGSLITGLQNVNYIAVMVPEPSTLLLAGLGIATLCLCAGRSRVSRCRKSSNR